MLAETETETELPRPSLVGTSGVILEVNLTTCQVNRFNVSPEDRRLYLGGKGLGLKYLAERLPLGTDPLDEKNVLCLMMGVVLGSKLPCSGRFNAVSKSPLTRGVMTSSCGGPFGMAYKTAGYEGLIITGKAQRPTTLVIDSKGVSFEDGLYLWGKDTQAAQTALKLGKNDGALVIGPAGENQVWFANICSGHRYLGRGGLGAVMGSKNVKAVVARGGEYQLVTADPSGFERLRKKARSYIDSNPFTAKMYRVNGTASNLNMCNRGEILPVNNFKRGAHPLASQISGEVMKERYHSTISTCRPCSILCGHKGKHADGSTHQVPEYETVALLGSNLNIFDPDQISKYNDMCGLMGLDTISTGGTLGWVMEAGEKGLVKTSLKFGMDQGILDAILDITFRHGFGGEMANGSRWLAEKYGGMDFAIQVKGMEMAGYDPRGSWGQGLAYAVANRGACHLSATLFPLEVFFGYMDPYRVQAKPNFVRFMEDLYAGVNSLPTCLFTSFAYILEPPLVKYTPKPVVGWLMGNLPEVAILLMDLSTFFRQFEVTGGVKLGARGFMQAGARIHTLERMLNVREGISRKDDTLPGRMLNEGRSVDRQERTVPLEPMLDAYYKLRGWDEKGIPKPRTLRNLKIDWLS